MRSGDATSQRPGPTNPRASVRHRGLALVVVLLAFRLPLLGHPTPVDLDEVNFMAALGFPPRYPVHHPGYPLWVAMGTAAHALGLSAYAAYQVWSVSASLAGPLLLYVGLRWVLADRLAWWLALGFGVNPLVWFLATTALSYPAGAAVGLAVVGLSHRALTERRAAPMYWAAAVLAVGISLRADLLITVGPLVAYVAWRFRRRGGPAAVMIVAAGLVAYLAEASYLYGRADPTEVHPELGHTVDVVLGTSVFRLGLWDGLARNVIKVLVNLGWDFGVAVVLVPPAIHRIARRRSTCSADVKATLLLWVLPMAAFLVLMHVVQGYFVLLLAAGYCAIGLALQDRFKPAVAARVAAAVAICSAVQFAAYPWSANGTGPKRLVDAKIAFQSASGLRQIDRRPEIHSPGDFWPTAAGAKGE